MEESIIKILLNHSVSLNVKSAVLEEPDEEEWLWSGDFQKAAKDIIKLFEEDKK
jgi:hypothetical protein